METTFIQQSVIAIIGSVAVWFFTQLSTSLLKLINSYQKQHMDSRATGVVAEGISIAVQTLVLEGLLPAIKDGRVTPEEMQTIKTRAMTVTVPRLAQLGGFVKQDIADWAQTKFDALVAMMLSRLGFSVISPDTEAS